MSIRKKFSGLGLMSSQFDSYKEKQKDYYEGQNDIKSYSNFFNNTINKDDNIGFYEANDVIEPFNVEFASSLKQVVGVLGKPTFVLNDSLIEDHKILFYKRKT